MKTIAKMMLTILAGAAVASCTGKKTEFKYTLDTFADLKVMRYQVPGWDDLTLSQKEYVYHLAEAAKWGRDIIWDQNCRHNIQLRHALEDILQKYEGDRNSGEYKQFEEYAKRVFFSNGIHHHYAEDKFFPACSQEYFASLLKACGHEADCELLVPYAFDPQLFPQRRAAGAKGDIVLASSVNYYDGVTRDEVERYYASIEVKGDPRPVAYGLNTKVVKENGKVVEKPWKVGGIYSAAIEKICAELEAAAACAENESQKKGLGLLVEYYRSGDLRKWDEYNIEWLQDSLGTVDYVNGFVEDYNDPLGRKGAWESYVDIKDHQASERTEKISAAAQWFEDHAPVDPRFRKKEVKGVSAKVINAVCLAGDSYPACAIGINLPNADWIRRDYGSKSVTISNITRAYDASAKEMPASNLREFAWDEAEIEFDKKYGAITGEVHTDLHECLGHGSGQLLPGVSSTAMGEFSSTLEEARADLFGLYFSADPKLVEMGILPDAEAYKAEYSSYIRNGLMTQFTRVELGKKNTEAHMQNRKLIAAWCYEKGAAGNVIEKKVRDGKTYFVVNDFVALRGLFAELLAEIQRIKSEGDYAAGKALVEKYAVDIDYDLHKEVLERYAALGLKPYGGFLNPEIVPVLSKAGDVVDYKLVYPENYLDQMLDYGRRYRTLD